MIGKYLMDETCELVDEYLAAIDEHGALSAEAEAASRKLTNARVVMSHRAASRYGDAEMSAINRLRAEADVACAEANRQIVAMLGSRRGR